MSNREQFEKLPGVAKEFKNSDGELYFCETESRYKNHRVFQDAQTGYLNGAWYAFQEQQKKIDTVKSKLGIAYDKCDDSEVATLLYEIQELLK